MYTNAGRKQSPPGHRADRVDERRPADLGAENTFEQCISEMALSGFTGSEIGNKYPKDVETLKQKLAIRGLQICNAWFSSTLLSEGYDATIKAFIEHRDFLHALGAKVIGALSRATASRASP
mgnify:FL=1